jgi:SAM-dependent methyltransferase
MNKKSFFKKEECRTCLSKNIEQIFSLAPTPPGNNFLSKEMLGAEEQKYPLEIKFCNDCFHIQLGHVVDPSILFQNSYSYVSGTSQVFVNHLKEYSKYVIDFLKIKKSSLIIDIGSNDGTCLEFFKNNGMRTLGVDPAKEVSEIASSKGIETINDFFSLDLANKILANYGSADLITSHNACAHIDKLDQIIEGVEVLLSRNGIFIFEVGYFVDVFQNKWFDTIYHEHVDFHTVAPLITLFDRFNMEIFRVERIKPQGGSIRVFTQKKGSKLRQDSSVRDLVNLEKSIGLNKPDAIIDFGIQISRIKDKFITLLNDIKKSGKNIVAFGAPTKATTLCHYFEIGKNHIDFIVDDNPLKQGLYSPGKHIPVYDASKIYSEKPDYLLILAWNFADAIMEKHQKYRSAGGSFILPMPSPMILKD